MILIQTKVNKNVVIEDLVIIDEEFVLGKDLETICCKTELKGMYKTIGMKTIYI